MICCSLIQLKVIYEVIEEPSGETNTAVVKVKVGDEEYFGIGVTLEDAKRASALQVKRTDPVFCTA